MLFPSIETVGRLFDRSWTDEEGFNGNGNCSVCINDTINRSLPLHASTSQTSPSAAGVVAKYSTAPTLSLEVYAQPPCTFTSSRSPPANNGQESSRSYQENGHSSGIKEFCSLRSRGTLRAILTLQKQGNPAFVHCEAPREVEHRNRPVNEWRLSPLG
jgi:hypothetical protein